MISYDDIVIASLNPEYYNIEKTFAYIVNDNEADKLNMNFTIIKKAPMDLEVSLFRFNEIRRRIRLGNRLIF